MKGAGATLACLLLVTSLAACRTGQPRITKLVGDRLIATRSISPHAYEHAARAMLYEEEGRLEDAAVEYQRALSYDHEAPELHASLARVFTALDRLEDAEAEIRLSMSIEPTVAGRSAQADLFLRRGQPDRAAGALEDAATLVTFEEEPELATSVHLEWADTLVMALRFPQAATVLADVIDHAPDAIEARFRLAAIHWAEGQDDKATQELSLLVTAEPHAIEAHLMLAWLAVARDDRARARDAFRVAHQRSEGAIEVTAAQARWLMASGQITEAQQLVDDLSGPTADAHLADEPTLLGRMELERIVRRPEQAMALAAAMQTTAPDKDQLGLILQAEGIVLADADRPEEAVRVLLRVPEDAGSFRTSRLRAAAVLRDSGEFDRARQILKDAGTDALNDEDRVSLAVARALVDERAGDPARALRTLAELDPSLADRDEVLLGRAGIEERRGNWKLALDLAETLLARDPGDVTALNFWGFVAADHRHDLGRALLRTKAAFILEPASGAILDSVGWALFQGGDIVRAAYFLQQAARIEGDDAEVLGHLAALLEKQNQPTQAIATLKRALTLSREDRVRRALETHLRQLEATTAAKRGAR